MIDLSISTKFSNIKIAVVYVYLTWVSIIYWSADVGVAMADCLQDQLLELGINDDILAYDFLTSIFVCAANSYRHDTVLRPFPPSYFNSGKDFDSLRRDLSKLLKLEDLLSHGCSDERALQLLYWLYSKNRFSLKTCDPNKFSEIKGKTGQTYRVTAPTHIFEVEHPPSLQEKFLELKGSRNVIYAYHGSKLENFYSILHNGLRNNLNKNALFGEGTYLSSELSVSLDYSPYGHGWSASMLGQKLSCVAVCEIIEDDGVKCKVQEGSKRRKRIEGSIGGDIPEKYYVVTNDDLLRVKYVLVYASRDKYLKKQQSWLSRHKFILLMVSYFLLLTIIGLYNSGFLRSTLFKKFIK